MRKIEEQILNRITQLRIQNGVSEKQLSRAIGRSPSYLSAMNNNQSMPSLRSIVAICDYFNITLYDFFSFDQNQYPGIINDLCKQAKTLNQEQIEILIKLIKSINQS